MAAKCIKWAAKCFNTAASYGILAARYIDPKDVGMNMRTTKNALDHTVVAFDELPPSGAYSIARVADAAPTSRLSVAAMKSACRN